MTLPARHSTVYPGHPITVASFILTKYGDDLGKAFEMTGGLHSCPRALADSDIPGAGDCVYRALSLLKRLQEGTLTPTQAIETAKKSWIEERTRCGHRDSLEPGILEAQSVEEDFLALVAKAIPSEG